MHSNSFKIRNPPVVGALQAAHTEELTGDSDLRLHHMPEDLELLNHK